MGNGEGRLRKTWVFRIVLSYSRKAYSEAILRLTTETLIRCLENAFRYFGGVVKTLVLDNLKAAVKHADWYDPELNPKLVEFARHYGFAILPIRARPPGVGKSHLAQAVGYQAIKSGFLVFYRSIFDLVRDFMEDEAFSGTNKALSRYLKPDLLIIDDMGLKQLPKKSGEYLFEIIMRRYENRSTIMTSNRPIEEWGKLVGDVPAATAILDRFLHHAEIVHITGKSYRMKDRASKDLMDKKARE